MLLTRQLGTMQEEFRSGILTQQPLDEDHLETRDEAPVATGSQLEQNLAMGLGADQS